MQLGCGNYAILSDHGTCMVHGDTVGAPGQILHRSISSRAHSDSLESSVLQQLGGRRFCLLLIASFKGVS